MSSNIKVFKLTYSGKFIEVSADKELDYFNLVDVIAVFVANQKRMYVWIPKKAAQSLKKHIPQIRQIFSKEYPEMVILRNITVDAGSEPPEFLELLGFTKEELLQHLQNVETNLLPIISEINRLKNDVDQYFISEEYEKAIFQANKIITLAQKIEDESLERDQMGAIKEAQIKAKAKQKLKEIEEECEIVINEFEKRIEAEDYRGAHNVVEDFKLLYDQDYNLMSIPLAKQIILMDNNLKETINKENTRIKDDLNTLQKKFEISLSNENMGMVFSIFNQINELIKQTNETKIKDTWQLIKNQFQKKKETFKAKIIEMTQKANVELEEKHISDAMKIYESVMNRLENAFGGNNYNQ